MAHQLADGGPRHHPQAGEWRQSLSDETVSRPLHQPAQAGVLALYPTLAGLLATVAHELRNPVGCIRNAVEVLRLMSPAHSETPLAYDLIDRQVAHMSQLIGDLMDTVRLSEGTMVPRSETLELGEIVRNCITDSRARLDVGGLKLSLDWPCKPVWAIGDLSRTYQIVSNVLQNAVKFTECGGHITVSLEPDQGMNVVRIIDTGAGIDPQTLVTLFEPFRQAERTRHLSSGGLGLGLSLVRGLARLQGGDIHAFSAGPGRGSEFRISVKRGLAEPTLETILEAFENDGNPSMT